MVSVLEKAIYFLGIRSIPIFVVSHSTKLKAFFILAGSRNPKAPVRDGGYHNDGYRLSLLSPLFVSGSVLAHVEKGCFTHYVTILVHKIIPLSTACSDQRRYEIMIKW